MNDMPMPTDGGSYRREPDGSLTRLDAAQIEHLGEPEVLDLKPAVHDGSATALPPIESQPRRQRRNQE